ncbi:MAG: hypothetical protein M3P32_08695 [Chloroflexota bacterium]|nr:hypothetical protein [Chloroflexota bacterium]
MDDKMTDDLQARIEQLERRTNRWDARASVETAFWAVMRNVFPDETRSHLKAASKEQLLAARSYLDHWIAKMGDAPEAEAPEPRETIKVE